MEKKTKKSNAYELGLLNSTKGIAGPGRPKMTDEAKALKKVEREVMAEYKSRLETMMEDAFNVNLVAMKLALSNRVASDMFGNVKELTPDSKDVGVALKAAQDVFNRVLGLPVQRTELTGKEGGPIEIDARQIILNRIANLANRKAISPDHSGDDSG